MDQHYSETTRHGRNNHPGRVRVLLAKRQSLDERRRERERDVIRREAMQLRSTIDKLNRTKLNLEADIKAELERAAVREPSHFAFPIFARGLLARRDNLKASIAALSERLAKVDQSLAQVPA
jgi:hypothetical protein